jgi:CRP-like cAMP-binding protein
MDKDNSPHNFNPENIEVILLVMNVTILVLQVLNMIMLKCGGWDILMKKPGCRKMQRACGGTVVSSRLDHVTLTKMSLNKVAPSWHKVSIRSENTEDEDHEDEVHRLMTSFSNSERHLQEQHAKMRRLSSIHVQQRVAARRKVRQTKALTKAAVFAGIDSAATEEVLAVMNYKRYEKGAIICKEGADADHFYIIVSGKCSVTARDAVGGVSMHVGDLKALDIMGENALIIEEQEEDDNGTSRVRSATVSVISDIVQTLELHRSEFERLVEIGIIGQEVLQRMRAVQKKRREIREALHPSQAQQRCPVPGGAEDAAAETSGESVALPETRYEA